MCKFMYKVHFMHYVRLWYVNTIICNCYDSDINEDEKIEESTNRIANNSYLGTIVTRDFDEALVAINDREVDNLGIC